jgi:hypothetical protein
MTYVNIILLGQMTRRTVIIPPLSPSHIGYNEKTIPFGEVFDVPRAAEELRMNLTEWRHVKNLNGTQPKSDPIGCWSSWALATLAFQPGWEGGTAENLPMTSSGPLKHNTKPDQHLICFDFLYWMVFREIWGEWEMEYSPQWQIATHIHWTKGVVNLANDYLMRLFKVSSPERIPSVRRGSPPYQVSNIRHSVHLCSCSPWRLQGAMRGRSAKRMFCLSRGHESPSE